MKKLILLALVLFPALTFAAKPTSQPDSAPPLKALWNDVLLVGPTCDTFVFLETGVRLVLYSGAIRLYTPDNAYISVLTEAFGAAGQEAIIRLFIEANGLDMTPADVPVDGAGQYDCLAWNRQLIGM